MTRIQQRRRIRAQTKRPKRERTKRTALAKRETKSTLTLPERIEQALVGGDLTSLTHPERLAYYKAVCKSLGLNPLTRPFDYIAFKETEDSPAKLILYARRDCTDQLRKLHKISVTSVKRSTEDGYFVAEVTVCDPTGRTDSALGVVPTTVWDKKKNQMRACYPRELANARMRAETKAKRRAVLSICGFGLLDVSELDTTEPYGYLTSGGRLAHEEEPAGSAEAAQAVADSKIAAYQAKKSGEPAPCLFYTHFPESDTYQVTGTDSLKTANRDLLKAFWNATANAIVLTPAQLEHLKYQLEQRKVEFRRLKEI